MSKSGGGVLKWLFIALLVPNVLAADPLQKSIDLTLDNHAAEQKTQKRIDQLSTETQDMLEQYQLMSRELDATRAYNDQIERLIDSQETEKVSIYRQMDDIELTQREIVPLMLRMIDRLEDMSTQGIPFLIHERTGRVNGLRKVMDRADVAVAEKYRRVLEAYQIELDYGRTIEAYQGPIDDAQDERMVNFLRVGRIGLYYQTLDGKRAGFWDATNKIWQPLPDAERFSLKQALRVARKQVAPDFIQVQVPAPEQLQ